MENFVRINIIKNGRVSYKMNFKVPATGLVKEPYRERSDVVFPDEVETMVLNISEIAFIKKVTMYAVDSTKATVKGGCLLSLLDPKDNDWCSDAGGKVVDIFSTELKQCDREITDDPRGFMYEAEVGLIVLRNGIKTNLGLNGMDVNQSIYIPLEDFENLMKTLLN